MHIVTKDVRELSPVEYQACLRNNYGDGGYMLHETKAARTNPDAAGAKAVMLWQTHEHEHAKDMLAWVLLTPTKLNGLTGVTPYIKSKSKYTAEFWVKYRHRRKGYATRLMKHVKRYYDPRPHVIPHDDASSELFSKFNVSVLAEDRYFMKKKTKIA